MALGVGGHRDGRVVLGRGGVAVPGNWYLGMRREVCRQQTGAYIWEASVQRRCC